MIEFINIHQSTIVAVTGVLIVTGFAGCAIMMFFFINRTQERDRSIISQYREKRDPQIREIIRAIIETCRLYTQDAPYVSSHFAGKIEIDIKNNQIMVRRSDGFWELNPNITCMLEVVKEACVQKQESMSDIDTSVSLIYESYGLEFDKIGKRTQIFFKKSSQMIEKLKRAEERLRDGLDSLKKVANVKE